MVTNALIFIKNNNKSSAAATARTGERKHDGVSGCFLKTAMETGHKSNTMKTFNKKYGVVHNGKYFNLKELKFVDNINEATVQTKGFWQWLRKRDQEASARMLNATITKMKPKGI